MTPLSSLGQDAQNEVQLDLFAHVLPLALPLLSHDTNSVYNGTIEVLMSR